MAELEERVAAALEAGHIDVADARDIIRLHEAEADESDSVIFKECWQLLVEALEVAPSQEVKDAIANVIDLRIKEL